MAGAVPLSWFKLWVVLGVFVHWLVVDFCHLDFNMWLGVWARDRFWLLNIAVEVDSSTCQCGLMLDLWWIHTSLYLYCAFHHLLCTVTGFGHSCGTIQCHSIGAPAGGEHRRDLLHRQRGSLRHLLPHPETDHPYLRRPQPSCLCHHERRDHVSAFPR